MKTQTERAGTSDPIYTLNRTIEQKKTEHAGLREKADQLVWDLKAAGKDPTKDAAAFAQVDAAYKAADQLQAEIAKLNDERGAIAEEISGMRRRGVVNGVMADDGAVLGPLPIGLTERGLQQMFQAAQNRTSFKPAPAGRRYGGGNSWEPGTGGWRADVGATDVGGVGEDREVAYMALEQVRIANYIPVKPVDSPTVWWYRQTATADAARVTAPGAAKPESSPAFERVEAQIPKIAHFSELQDEIIKDWSEWRRAVGDAMIAGLISKENQQILSGDGVDHGGGVPDMVGMLETDGINSVSRDGTNAEFRLQAIHRGITAVRTTAHVDPTVIILHPNDYEQALFEKTTGSGEFIAGDPLAADAPSFWGTQVLLTTDQPEGTGLVGNLPVAARIYLREAPVWDVHPYGGGREEFIHNITLTRAEERLIVAVRQPLALCEVTNL